MSVPWPFTGTAMLTLRFTRPETYISTHPLKITWQRNSIVHNKQQHLRDFNTGCRGMQLLQHTGRNEGQFLSFCSNRQPLHKSSHATQLSVPIALPPPLISIDSSRPCALHLKRNTHYRASTKVCIGFHPAGLTGCTRYATCHMFLKAEGLK